MFKCPHCAYCGANYSRTLKHILLAHKSESKPILLPPDYVLKSPAASPESTAGAPTAAASGQQAIPLYSNEELIKKRQLIEGMKLDKELEALKSPNTNMDMFKEMLALQNNNFTQLLKMQQEQANLQVQLAKLEAGGDGGADWSDDVIKALLPALPEILKQRVKQDASTQKEVKKEMPKPKKPTKAQLEEYKLKIRAGEITYEQFMQDAATSYPEIKNLSDEKTKEIYEKIKAGKL